MLLAATAKIHKHKCLNTHSNMHRNVSMGFINYSTHINKHTLLNISVLQAVGWADWLVLRPERPQAMRRSGWETYRKSLWLLPCLLLSSSSLSSVHHTHSRIRPPREQSVNLTILHYFDGHKLPQSQRTSGYDTV